MEYEIVTLKEKKIVGIGNHLSNDDSQSSQKIGDLWGQVFTLNLDQKIENRVNAIPICLYSDYEDTLAEGKNLSYDITIGYEVEKENVYLEKWVSKIIPAGKYARFVIKGELSLVGEAWNAIWAMPLDRSYTGDFEQYMNEDMENAEVEIYVALKSE